MKNEKKGNQRTGFTMAEMAIASAVGAILLVAIALLFRNSLQNISAIRAETILQHDVRKSLHQVATELRTARSNATVANSVVIQSNTSPADAINVFLPVFSMPGGSCTAYGANAITSAPVTCAVDSECETACNTSISAVVDCTGGRCYKQYQYQQNAGAGIPQLIAVDLSGQENNRVVGNYIEMAQFQDNQAASPVTDTNLADNEIRITIRGEKESTEEGRTRQTALQTVVNIRN